jgi:DNA-binding response OmpR family regulator
MGDGLQVLVVEDDGLVAAFIVELLEELDLAVAGPFAAGADACAWLRDRTPDAAVVDVALADGTSERAVAELRRRGVPLVIFSGLDPSQAPAVCRGADWLAKPACAEALARAVLRAVAHGPPVPAAAMAHPRRDVESGVPTGRRAPAGLP